MPIAAKTAIHHADGMSFAVVSIQCHTSQTNDSKGPELRGLLKHQISSAQPLAREGNRNRFLLGGPEWLSLVEGIVGPHQETQASPKPEKD